MTSSSGVRRGPEGIHVVTVGVQGPEGAAAQPPQDSEVVAGAGEQTPLFQFPLTERAAKFSVSLVTDNGGAVSRYEEITYFREESGASFIVSPSEGDVFPFSFDFIDNDPNVSLVIQNDHSEDITVTIKRVR